MQLTRRLFVAGAVASPLTFHLAGMNAFAQDAASGAPAPDAPTQVVAVQHFRFGDHVVTAISDGFLDIDISVLSNVTAEEAQAILAERFLAPLPIVTGINAYVVRTGEETVLIDAGGAGAFPTMGQLVASLSAVDLSPDDIDVVLLTHMHPDHVGAMVTDGGAAFPNAVVRVHQAEIDYWTSAEMREAAGDAGAAFFDLAQAVVDAYGDRVEPFTGEAEVATGIVSRELFGHTPGHSGFLVGTGDEQLLVWGDIVHVGPLQFANPRIGLAFDTDPAEAIATREALLLEVAEARLRVAGMHISFPGIGYVVAAEEGSFRFEPQVWQYALEG